MSAGTPSCFVASGGLPPQLWALFLCDFYFLLLFPCAYSYVGLNGSVASVSVFTPFFVPPWISLPCPGCQVVPMLFRGSWHSFPPLGSEIWIFFCRHPVSVRSHWMPHFASLILYFHPDLFVGWPGLLLWGGVFLIRVVLELYRGL